MKKKNGFTLIELLAVIVIIAIGGTIAAVSITQNILKSRNTTVIELSKTYIDSVRTMRAKDDFYYNPKVGEAIVLPCDSINGTEIEHKDSTGYGDILKEYCYVGVTNDGNSKYSYYMTLVDDTYHMVIGKEYNTISEDDILQGSDNLVSVSKISTPFRLFEVEYGGNTYHINSIRVKYNAKENGTEKTTSLYGYYTNDPGSNMNAHIKGSINEFDNFISGTNKVKKINGINYTILDYEVLYIALKK